MTEPARKTRGDDAARQWASDLAEQFGKAVQRHRNRLGLSAVQLSNRCSERGYPITRSTIAKIESNARAGKMDVAEVLVLAAALEVAPVDLVFPGFPDRRFSAIPKVEMAVEDVLGWWSMSPDYNQFTTVTHPRVTLSRELREAVAGYRQALDGFVGRHDLARDPDTETGYRLMDVPLDDRTGGISDAWRQQLTREYELVTGLRDEVARLGGEVSLPDWFETFTGAPF